METVTIEVPNWHKWQKYTQAKAEWFGMSIDFYNDDAIQALQYKHLAATHVFIWLLTRCAKQKSNKITLCKTLMWTQLRPICGIRSNNFSVEKYLKLISKHGLIRFSVQISSLEIDIENESNDIQLDIHSIPTPVQLEPNLGSTHAQLDLNSSSTTPVEPPQTQAPTELLQTYTLHDNTRTTSNEVGAPRHPVWGEGVDLLMNTGILEPQARSLLGRLAKQYGEGALTEAISACVVKQPIDPKMYLLGCLKKGEERKAQNKAVFGQNRTPSLRHKQRLLQAKRLKNKWTNDTYDGTQIEETPYGSIRYLKTGETFPLSMLEVLEA